MARACIKGVVIVIVLYIFLAAALAWKVPLASLAGTMRHRGMGQEAILAALGEENKRCQPPLPDDEVRQIAASVSRYAPTTAPVLELILTRREEPESSDDLLPPTDVGNAKRLVRRYGGGIRHCGPLGNWLVNDGKRWWVVSIFWTGERPDLKIPEKYLP